VEGVEVIGKLWDLGEYCVQKVIQAADAMQLGVKVCEGVMEGRV